MQGWETRYCEGVLPSRAAAHVRSGRPQRPWLAGRVPHVGAVAGRGHSLPCVCLWRLEGLVTPHCQVRSVMGDWGQRSPPCPKLSHSLRQDNQRRHLNSQSPALDLSSPGGWWPCYAVSVLDTWVYSGWWWRSLGCEGSALLGSWLRATEPFRLQVLPTGCWGLLGHQSPPTGGGVSGARP